MTSSCGKYSVSERKAEAIKKLRTITAKDTFFDKIPLLEEQISKYSWSWEESKKVFI